MADPFIWEILPCAGRQAKPEMWAFLSHRRLTAYSEINERASNFQIADHSSRIGGFAEHQGSTTLTLRGHPTRPSRSARLSRWGSNPCSRALPKRWTSSLIAWRRPEFSEHTTQAACTTENVRIRAKHPKIAQC